MKEMGRPAWGQEMVELCWLIPDADLMLSAMLTPQAGWVVLLLTASLWKHDEGMV